MGGAVGCAHCMIRRLRRGFCCGDLALPARVVAATEQAGNFSCGRARCATRGDYGPEAG